MTPLAPHIAAFLRDYLPKQRGASQHTCDTYAYSFKLLFIFASNKLKQRPSELGLEQIDAPMITAFLGKSPLLAGDRHRGQSESQRKLGRGRARNRVCSCGCSRGWHAGPRRDIDTLEGRRL